MTTNLYKCLTTADVTIDHVMTLFNPSEYRYSICINHNGYNLAERKGISATYDVTQGDYAFAIEDAAFLTCVSDARVLECEVTYEGLADGKNPTVNVCIEL